MVKTLFPTAVPGVLSSYLSADDAKTIQSMIDALKGLTMKGSDVLTMAANPSSVYFQQFQAMISFLEGVALQTYHDTIGFLSIGIGFNLDQFGEESYATAKAILNSISANPDFADQVLVETPDHQPEKPGYKDVFLDNKPDVPLSTENIAALLKICLLGWKDKLTGKASLLYGYLNAANLLSTTFNMAELVALQTIAWNSGLMGPHLFSAIAAWKAHPDPVNANKLRVAIQLIECSNATRDVGIENRMLKTAALFFQDTSAVTVSQRQVLRISPRQIVPDPSVKPLEALPLVGFVDGYHGGDAALTIPGCGSDNSLSTNEGDTVVLGADGGSVLTGGTGDTVVLGGSGNNVFVHPDAPDRDRYSFYASRSGKNTYTMGLQTGELSISDANPESSLVQSGIAVTGFVLDSEAVLAGRSYSFFLYAATDSEYARSTLFIQAVAQNGRIIIDGFDADKDMFGIRLWNTRVWPSIPGSNIGESTLTRKETLVVPYSVPYQWTIVNLTTFNSNGNIIDYKIVNLPYPCSGLGCGIGLMPFESTYKIYFYYYANGLLYEDGHLIFECQGSDRLYSAYCQLEDGSVVLKYACAPTDQPPTLCGQPCSSGTCPYTYSYHFDKNSQVSVAGYSDSGRKWIVGNSELISNTTYFWSFFQPPVLFAKDSVGVLRVTDAYGPDPYACHAVTYQHASTANPRYLLDLAGRRSSTQQNAFSFGSLQSSAANRLELPLYLSWISRIVQRYYRSRHAQAQTEKNAWLCEQVSNDQLVCVASDQVHVRDYRRMENRNWSEIVSEKDYQCHVVDESPNKRITHCEKSGAAYLDYEHKVPPSMLTLLGQTVVSSISYSAVYTALPEAIGDGLTLLGVTQENSARVKMIVRALLWLLTGTIIATLAGLVLRMVLQQWGCTEKTSNQVSTAVVTGLYWSSALTPSGLALSAAATASGYAGASIGLWAQKRLMRPWVEAAASKETPQAVLKL